jgi:hypothetical protein
VRAAEGDAAIALDETRPINGAQRAALRVRYRAKHGAWPEA